MLKAALPGILAIFALFCFCVLGWVDNALIYQRNPGSQANRLLIGAIGILLALFLTVGFIFQLAALNG